MNNELIKTLKSIFKENYIDDLEYISTTLERKMHYNKSTKKSFLVDIYNVMFKSTNLNTINRPIGLVFNTYTNIAKVLIHPHMVEHFKYKFKYYEMLQGLKNVSNDYSLDEKTLQMPVFREHELTIENFLPEKFLNGETVERKSTLLIKHNINNFSVSTYIGIDYDYNYILYYTEGFRVDKKSSQKIFSPRRVIIENKPFTTMYETALYDLYIKKEYNIKKRTDKELLLVKMIRI